MRKEWTPPELKVAKPRRYNPNALLDDAVIDAMMDDAHPLPSETALYARLANTMLDAMQRAQLTDAQQDIVTNAFHDTTLALMLDAQRAGVVQPAATKEEIWAAVRADIAEHQRFRFDAGLPDDPQMAVVDVHCMACRRDLGRALIPTSAASLLESSVACRGCGREGRGHNR